MGILGAIRSMLVLIASPPHLDAPHDPNAQQARTENGDADAYQRAIAAALDTLVEQYKASNKSRDEHERQVRAVDKKRLRIERVAMWTVIVGGTAAIVTLYLSIRSVDEARKAATAAQSAADTARKQLEAIDRPWIKVADIVVNSPVRVSDDGVNVFLGFTTTVKNVGRSVARNVGIRAAMYPQTGTSAFFTEPIARQHALCDPPDTDGFLKVTVFPDDTTVWQSSLSLSRSEILETAKSFTGAPYQALEPVLIGCVTYEYGGSDRVHRTLFAYQVVRTTPQEPNLPHLFDAANLPSDLRFIRLTPFPNSKANDAE